MYLIINDIYSIYFPYFRLFLNCLLVGKSMAIITPVNIAIAICQRINLGKNVVAWDSLSLIIKMKI